MSFLCFSANDCQQLCQNICYLWHSIEICKNITHNHHLTSQLVFKRNVKYANIWFCTNCKSRKEKNFAWCLNFENGSESNMYSNGRTWFEFTLSCGFILYLVKHQFSWMAVQSNIDCTYFIQKFLQKIVNSYFLMYSIILYL